MIDFELGFDNLDFVGGIFSQRVGIMWKLYYMRFVRCQ